MLFFSLLVRAEGDSPFQMNGWQFHEYDLPKLEEAIHEAPDYGVNFFVFSHRLFRSVEGFLLSGDDFAQRMFISQRKEEYKKRAEEALQALDRTHGGLYGLDADTGHRYFIDIFVAKMRRRMSLPDEARAEDDVRLEKVRLKLDVDRN